MNTDPQENNPTFQASYPWSFHPNAEPRTMPAGWDLSGILEAQEKTARAKAPRRARKMSVQKQIPLNPVSADDDQAGLDYRWDVFSGPSTYPSRWNLD